MTQTTANTPTPATLLRQLFAASYDAFIIIAIFMVATLIILPFNHYQAIKPHTAWYSIFLLTLWFTFYAASWRRGGQTIGMRAWRIRLLNQKAAKITLRQMLVRFFGSIIFSALLALNYWWKFIDKQNLTLADRLSHTRLVKLC